MGSGNPSLLLNQTADGKITGTYSGPNLGDLIWPGWIKADGHLSTSEFDIQGNKSASTMEKQKETNEWQGLRLERDGRRTFKVSKKVKIKTFPKTQMGFCFKIRNHLCFGNTLK